MSPRIVFGAIAVLYLACAAGTYAQPVCPVDSSPSVLDPLASISLPDDYAQEGIASDGTQFWTSSGIFFLKCDLAPIRLAFFAADWGVPDLVKNVDYAEDLQHIGDIDVAGDYIYAPISNFCASVCGDTELSHIAWFYKDTLQPAGYIDLSGSIPFIGDGDLAGVAVHNNVLYAVEYQVPDQAPRIFAFPLTDGVPTSTPTATYPIASWYANGIEFYGDNIYVSAGTGSFGSCGLCAVCCPSAPCDGTIDVYDLASLSESVATQPFASYTYDCPYTHAQGLAFAGQDLWTAQNDHVIHLQRPILDDAFEPNDTPDAATSLMMVNGVAIGSNLSATNDDDWYSFSLNITGIQGNYARLTFASGLGNLEMCLYESDVTLVACSQNSWDIEEISLADLPPATYLLRVYGQQGDINPCYNLRVSLAEVLIGDFDGDDDVDLVDFRQFSVCVSGSGVTGTPSGCNPHTFADGDTDNDHDIDVDDFILLQSAWTGPYVPPNYLIALPGCFGDPGCMIINEQLPGQPQESSFAVIKNTGPVATTVCVQSIIGIHNPPPPSDPPEGTGLSLISGMFPNTGVLNGPPNEQYPICEFYSWQLQLVTSGSCTSQCMVLAPASSPGNADTALFRIKVFLPFGRINDNDPYSVTIGDGATNLLTLPFVYNVGGTIPF